MGKNHWNRCAWVWCPYSCGSKGYLSLCNAEVFKTEITSGPVKKSLQQRKGLPLVTLVGEVISLRSHVDIIYVGAIGFRGGAIVPTRQWRELYTAFEGSLVAGLHLFILQHLESLSLLENQF